MRGRECLGRGHQAPGQKRVGQGSEWQQVRGLIDRGLQARTEARSNRRGRPHTPPGETRLDRLKMPAGPGTPASPGAPASASDPDSSGPPDCPPSPLLTRGSPESPAPRQAAVRASVPQKLAETLSSQYGLNVFVAGLLFLLAWAVHAAGVGKRDLLCFLTALMLLQLLWMLWYVGRSYAQRRLIRPKDAHAGARWLRGECSGRALPSSAPSLFLGLFSGSPFPRSVSASNVGPLCPQLLPYIMKVTVSHSAHSFS